MNKVALLQEKATIFRGLLIAAESKSVDAHLLLKWLSPLFEKIDRGEVFPPKHYEYKLALGKDNPLYEPGSPFLEAEAEFVAALEDWDSKSWYRKP